MHRLRYHVGVELLDLHVPEPLSVRLCFCEAPRKARKAGKGQQHTPVVLSGSVGDRTERRQFFGGQILRFVDEDRESDAFLFCRVGEVVDQLLEVRTAAAELLQLRVTGDDTRPDERLQLQLGLLTTTMYETRFQLACHAFNAAGELVALYGQALSEAGYEVSA